MLPGEFVVIHLFKYVTYIGIANPNSAHPGGLEGVSKCVCP